MRTTLMEIAEDPVKIPPLGEPMMDWVESLQWQSQMGKVANLLHSMGWALGCK